MIRSRRLFRITRIINPILKLAVDIGAAFIHKTSRDWRFKLSPHQERWPTTSKIENRRDLRTPSADPRQLMMELEEGRPPRLHRVAPPFAQQDTGKPKISTASLPSQAFTNARENRPKRLITVGRSTKLFFIRGGGERFTCS